MTVYNTVSKIYNDNIFTFIKNWLFDLECLPYRKSFKFKYEISNLKNMILNYQQILVEGTEYRPYKVHY